MHYAAASGNPYHSLVALLESVTSEVTAKGSSSVVTAMHLAASHGHEEALVVLLSKLTQINAFDSRGQTALHMAAQNGHVNIVLALLKEGAHVSIHDQTANRQTPVHAAAANGHDACLSVLLENTEDAEVFNARDAHGQTPLMLAVAGGHHSAVELLIVSGSHCEAVDNYKRTALFRGAAFGQEQCVQLLLNQNVSSTTRDVHGKTAFHVAAQRGQVGVLRKLLDELENAESVHDLIDKDGLTPLHWAAYEGHEGCVDLLIGMMANYIVRGSEFSPLHCAV